MDIYDLKIVQDTTLFGAFGVSVRCGRKAVDALEAEGLVDPLVTPTGRRVLSFGEAEAVIKSLSAAAESRRGAMVSEGSSSRVAA